jgi:hypothetical protein
VAKAALRRDAADRAAPIASIERGEAAKAEAEAFDNSPAALAAEAIAAYTRSAANPDAKRKAAEALLALIAQP